MELDYDQRISTGAFYTPKMWANFCVERLHRVLPTFDGFTFYDPAAGEGALLDALPEGTDCYASTIEREDVEILRGKGYEAEQFDFLTMNTNFLHPNILAARDEGTLIVLTNPPFFSTARKQIHTDEATLSDVSGFGLSVSYADIERIAPLHHRYMVEDGYLSGCDVEAIPRGI